MKQKTSSPKNPKAKEEQMYNPQQAKEEKLALEAKIVVYPRTLKEVEKELLPSAHHKWLFLLFGKKTILAIRSYLEWLASQYFLIIDGRKEFETVFGKTTKDVRRFIQCTSLDGQPIRLRMLTDDNDWAILFAGMSEEEIANHLRHVRETIERRMEDFHTKK